MSSFSFTASPDSGIIVTGGGSSVAMEVIQIAGPQGPAGTSSNAIQVPFSWGDATPSLVSTVLSNKTVFKVELILLVAFDTVSTLTVGDASNNQRLFASDSADLSQVGSYQSNPNYSYGTTTNVNLYLTPGVGNTQGSGLILLYIQE